MNWLLLIFLKYWINIFLWCLINGGLWLMEAGHFRWNLINGVNLTFRFFICDLWIAIDSKLLVIRKFILFFYRCDHSLEGSRQAPGHTLILWDSWRPIVSCVVNVILYLHLHCELLLYEIAHAWYTYLYESLFYAVKKLLLALAIDHLEVGVSL